MNARVGELQTHSEHDSEEESSFAAMGVWTLITKPVGTPVTAIEDVNYDIITVGTFFFLLLMWTVKLIFQSLKGFDVGVTH
jgi:hypothetical protein